MTLAPSAAEIVFSLGAASRVVGISSFAKDLPEAAGKLQLGGFQPDIERLLSLRPDLVIVSRDGTDRRAFEQLQSLGLSLLVTGGTSLEGVLSDVRNVGRAIGEEERAKKLAASLSARLEAARARSLKAQEEKRFPAVLVLIWPDPPVAAGPSSFIGDLLEKGAIPSAVPKGSGEWPQVTFETIASWNPGVIIHPETEENRAVFKKALSTNPHWKLVEAFRQGRIAAVPGNMLERPGPRLVDALEKLLDVLSMPRR